MSSGAPRAAVLAALLLAAPCARAADDEDDARLTAHHPATGACECLNGKRCWKLVREVIGRNAELGKQEVEGAAADRFFPGTAAFALLEPDPQGHFLKLQCPGAAGCGEKLDELERRFVVTTLLSSLPLGVPRAKLFNEKTWIPTDKGEQIFSQARTCKPDLLKILAEIIVRAPSK